ncbi:hypothetical protein [Psychroserpens sp. Hel_I_66]|uniref:hypothetical protein n=1 Tax=Psychroserpens sp. Hel_I_66 TaxID=1250004 RepID=UPI0006480781|nr:hypothetical protein [Psychroserpens sp. Hel_I_66]
MKSILNIRIDELLKKQIELAAQDEGMTASEYTRNILEGYFDFNQGENTENVIPIRMTMYVSTPFHETKEYVFLITWLYSKVVNPYVYESNQQVLSIKRMLELAIKDQVFSNDFRFELLKVLNDLNNYLYQPDGTGKQFWFCVPNNMFSLDCNIMYNEICTIQNL